MAKTPTTFVENEDGTKPAAPSNPDGAVPFSIPQVPHTAQVSGAEPEPNPAFEPAPVGEPPKEVETPRVRVERQSPPPEPPKEVITQRNTGVAPPVEPKPRPEQTGVGRKAKLSPMTMAEQEAGRRALKRRHG